MNVADVAAETTRVIEVVAPAHHQLIRLERQIALGALLRPE